MKFDLLTIDWTAIASILTFVIAVIAVIPILRDRARVKIDLKIQLYPDLNDPKFAIKYYNVKLLITNTGKRRIGITTWGKTIPNKKIYDEEASYDLICRHVFDKGIFLEEGEFTIVDDSIITRAFPLATSFFVIDTTGKKWTSSWIKGIKKHKTIKGLVPMRNDDGGHNIVV
jgi:hypothetical protein